MQTPEGLDWQRPHPLTLLVEVVNALKQMAFPIIFVLSGRGAGLDGLFELAIVIVPLGIAAARFWSTRYAIDDIAVYHRHGVFNRQEQVLPRANVQNVNTRAQLIARITNLTELQISDASSDGDINLRLLAQPEAERITALLRGTSGFAGESAATGLIEQPDGSLAPEPPRPPLVETSPRDLIFASIGYGLAAGPLVFTVVGVLVLVVAVFTVDLGSVSRSAWLLGPSVLPLMLLTSLPRTLGPIVRLFGFKLWADPDRIRSEAGLITQQRTAARRERVQLVQVDRYALMRRFGLERVRFATADLEGFYGDANTYLDPGGQLDAWPVLAQAVLGQVEVSDAQLLQVSPLTRRRTLVRFVVGAIVLVVCAVGLAIAGSGIAASLLVAAAAGLVLFGDWYSRRRFARLGFAVGAEQMITRTGVVDETLKLLRKEKVQSVRLDQTWFQRRLDLASLLIGTAGSGGLGAVRLPDLTLETALQLADHLAQASAATRLSDTI